jgi:hypothetical protein
VLGEAAVPSKGEVQKQDLVDSGHELGTFLLVLVEDFQDVDKIVVAIAGQIDEFLQLFYRNLR